VAGRNGDVSKGARKVAYLHAPDGRVLQVGATEVRYLETLVRDGPFGSVSAWVRAHLGRDHGYRREDVWRYVDAGLAVVERPRPEGSDRQRGASYGRVEAPLQTVALVAWYDGRKDDSSLAAAIDAGWRFRPGSHPSSSHLYALP
jgi:Arc/MetJ-type ribon-helix-helix transcriptional regulator